MQIGINQTHEDVPPIVDQSIEPCRQPAASQIPRRKTSPTPLVLHLVEDVFSIAPIPIELTEGFGRRIDRGDENRVLVEVRRFADFSKRQLRQSARAALRQRHRALQTPAQHDGAPLTAPAFQPNFALLGPEALTGVDPISLRKPGDHPFDVLGQTKLEQIRQNPSFGLAHDALVAEPAIAAQQRWP